MTSAAFAVVIYFFVKGLAVLNLVPNSCNGFFIGQVAL